MLLIGLARILCYGLGAYSTFKALQGRPNLAKRQRWASFWITLTAFEILEPILDWTIFWVPFYYNFKLIFLLSLCYARTRATTPVFKQFVHPVLSHKRKNIEHVEKRITDAMTIVHTRVRTVVRRVSAQLPQIHDPMAASETIFVDEELTKEVIHTVETHEVKESDDLERDIDTPNNVETMSPVHASESAEDGATVNSDIAQPSIYPSIDEFQNNEVGMDYEVVDKSLLRDDSAIDVRYESGSPTPGPTIVSPSDSPSPKSTLTSTVDDDDDTPKPTYEDVEIIPERGSPKKTKADSAGTLPTSLKSAASEADLADRLPRPSGSTSSEIKRSTSTASFVRSNTKRTATVRRPAATVVRRAEEEGDSEASISSVSESEGSKRGTTTSVGGMRGRREPSIVRSTRRTAIPPPPSSTDNLASRGVRSRSRSSKPDWF
ncbi:TB2/DP1, HVA22 family-domain-containing protein [Phlyctochytrium arcticum]|nr:TB2/DP1, HVA22 family-domain-containing protein [Phlyctochytrium arcticum]